MKNKLQEVAEKINALSLRERLMVIVTFAVLVIFLWWNFFAVQVLAKTKQLQQQNKSLQAEIQTLDLTSASIQKRLNDGVFRAKEQKLKLLRQKLEKVSQLLNEKTQALIDPDEMFELMQQLISAESKLKLISLSRKSVEPVFTLERQVGQEPGQEPGIYQHVLQMTFEGKYQNILDYIQAMEGLEWKLIWDRITLESSEYPIINVNIEISTLSDNENWVGL